jgi:hypothetical protein
VFVGVVEVVVVVLLGGVVGGGNCQTVRLGSAARHVNWGSVVVNPVSVPIGTAPNGTVTAGTGLKVTGIGTAGGLVGGGAAGLCHCPTYVKAGGGGVVPLGGVAPLCGVGVVAVVGVVPAVVPAATRLGVTRWEVPEGVGGWALGAIGAVVGTELNGAGLASGPLGCTLVTGANPSRAASMDGSLPSMPSAQIPRPPSP